MARFIIAFIVFAAVSISDNLHAEEVQASTCVDELTNRLCSVFRNSDEDILNRDENNTYVYNYYAMGGKPDLSERLNQTDGGVSSDPTLQKDELNLARTERLLTRVRDMLTELISAGRNRDSLSAAEKSILDRLARTRFGVYEPDYPRCRENGLGAATGGIDAIYLCPRMLNATDEELFAALAHELAHSIDPCTLSMDVLQARPETLEEDDNGQTAWDRCEAINSKIGIDIDSLERDFRVFPLLLDSADPRGLIEGAKSCNLMEVAYPAVPFEDRPYREYASCLTQAYIPGLRRQVYQSTVQSAQKAGTPIENIGREFQRNLARRDVRCDTKVAEHFADGVSAHLLNEFLLNRNTENRSLISRTGFLNRDLATVCAADEPERLSRLADGGRYPEALERLRIQLQYPRVRNLVGCRSEEPAPTCGAFHLNSRTEQTPPPTNSSRGVQ